LKEDLTIDTFDAKHLKVSLVALKGRLAPYNLLTNEFVNEEIVSFANIRIRDLEDQNSKEILHVIDLNRQFYNPREAAANT